MRAPWAEGDVDLGPVRVLVGDRGGRYPDGNSLLIRGREETVLVDPSLSVAERVPELAPQVDRLIHSHVHEDHLAGSFGFPDVPWHAHSADVVGFRSLDDMMAIYGYPEPIASAFRKTVVERYHYVPRPDAIAFEDGDRFDLGGVRICVLHTPGHTRGHSALFVEPDDLLYLGDIDLSSFGPYYGDAWSDLEDFERSLDRVRQIEARGYATFHHIGVLQDRSAFLARLDRFRAVIADREQRLLAYLSEPRTLDEIAAHRFVYRPGDPVPFAYAVEARSMSQHLARLERQGRVCRGERGSWRAVRG
ncbi:MAG: MBL fold metallo-hydrolase [Myxococcota bacterium]